MKSWKKYGGNSRTDAGGENDEDKDDNMRLVIRRTKSLIHEFYARGITWMKCGKLNVTPEYLGSQFHKEVGVTFSTYMKEYRIQKGKEAVDRNQI